MNTPIDILAFPSVHEGDRIEPGMTLRDFLAAHALAGLLAGWMKTYVNGAEIGAMAYELADAALAARGPKGGA